MKTNLKIALILLVGLVVISLIIFSVSALRFKGLDNNPDFELISKSEWPLLKPLKSLSISDNGQSWGYRIDDRIVVNGKVVTKSTYNIFLHNISFDQTGEQYGVRFERAGKRYVIINDKEYGPYDNEDLYLEFNPFWNKSGDYWYTFQKEGKWYAMISGTVHGPYPGDSIDRPFVQFCYNSMTFGIKYTKDNSEYFEFKNKTYGPYKSIEKIYDLEKQNDFVMLINDRGNKKVITKDKNITIGASANLGVNTTDGIWYITGNPVFGNYVNGEPLTGEYRKILYAMEDEGSNYIFYQGEDKSLYMNDTKLADSYDGIKHKHIKDGTAYIFYEKDKRFYFTDGNTTIGPLEYASHFYTDLQEGSVLWTAQHLGRVYLYDLDTLLFSHPYFPSSGFKPIIVNNKPALYNANNMYGTSNVDYINIIIDEGKSIKFGPYLKGLMSNDGGYSIIRQKDDGHYLIYNGKEYGPFKTIKTPHLDYNFQVVGVQDFFGYIKTYRLK